MISSGATWRFLLEGHIPRGLTKFVGMGGLKKVRLLLPESTSISFRQDHSKEGNP
jgi:hypothetical protein